jgi:hypothetical protein
MLYRGLSWRPEDDDRLRELWPSKLSGTEIGVILGRSKQAVNKRAKTIGLPGKPRGGHRSLAVRQAAALNIIRLSSKRRERAKTAQRVRSLENKLADQRKKNISLQETVERLRARATARNMPRNKTGPRL